MSKRMSKRILAAMVSMAMLLTLFAPMQAYAQEDGAAPWQPDGTELYAEEEPAAEGQDLAESGGDVDPFADEVPDLTRWVEKYQRSPVLWSAIQMQEKAQKFSRIEEQVKFLKDNGLVDAGYEFFVLDGWLRDCLEGENNASDSRTKINLGNGHGYPTAPYGQWVQDGKDYTDFVQLCVDNGLKPGVYWNPCWVIRSDVVNEDGSFTDNTVWGTDIKLKDIVRLNADGTMAGGQDPFLGYIDLNKEGAETFIKGFIHYYRSLGVCYQKVDFVPTQFNQYGKDGLEKLYRWIREAAGPDYVFSISMAPCPNYGELEFTYGDLVRVSVDTGDWGTFSSSQRGVIHPNAYCNAITVFDAFNYFAERAGAGPRAGVALMDGDESRSYPLTAEEVKSVVSYKVLGGGGIQFSDIYDRAVGDGKNETKLWAFQNAALIELANEGFIAKPLQECEKPDVTALLGGDPWKVNNHWVGGSNAGVTFTMTDTEDPKAQIVAGQCENGDWVIGLFNREDSPRARSFRLLEDLGLTGQWNMTDLWADESGAGLGVVTGGWSTMVPAHGCRILRLSPAEGEAPYAAITLDQHAVQLDTKAEEGKNTVTLTASVETSADYGEAALAWASTDESVATLQPSEDGRTAVVTA